MGFLSFLEVASMPIIEVLIISTLGAFMGTGYCNLLPADARRSLNKIVFMVFTPALIFSSLVKTVTLEDIISWWFMPINIGLTFLFGGIFGWILVKILKPEPYLQGLVIAMSASGNLGNLLLIIVNAICHEKGSPFGDGEVCSTIGLSYASFSMALGGFYIWTYTFHLIKASAVEYETYKESLEKLPSTDFDDNAKTPLLSTENKDQVAIVFSTSRSFKEEQEKLVIPSPRSIPAEEKPKFWGRVKIVLHEIAKEFIAPPTLAAFVGLAFGAVGWLKNLLVGDEAPLRVIQSSIELLGDGTIPCITLILGGNLIQGLRSSKLKMRVIVGVIVIRYVILPGIGIGVVRAANSLGFLPSDPLYHYILLVQFTLPPAMTVGTMTQLVDVGQAECSVLFLWTYAVAALALTAWSTVYMWILS
uniref:Protein PIN-LIKES 7-like n=1 Tax=Kalanchoe fedtschenkoi TaxID=63787 RepID=A0A7N0UIN0_KALFE